MGRSALSTVDNADPFLGDDGRPVLVQVLHTRQENRVYAAFEGLKALLLATVYPGLCHADRSHGPSNCGLCKNRCKHRRLTSRC